MKIANRIKQYAREGLRYLVLTAALTSPFVLSEYVNSEKGYRDGYRVIKTKGIKASEARIVRSFKDEYKYAEPWRAATHWYDPWVIRQVKFNDGSEVTIEYPLLSNCSYAQRKVLGPEQGDKCILEDNSLKKVR